MKWKSGKRVLSILLTLAMVMGLMPQMAVAARADDSVDYIYYTYSSNTLTKHEGSVTDYTTVESSTEETPVWNGYKTPVWYVVKGNVEITNRIKAIGDVHLILMDGAT